MSIAGKGHRISVTERSATAHRTRPSGNFDLDPNVHKVFDADDIEVIKAFRYGTSLWGPSARIIARLPSGEPKKYLLKTVVAVNTGKAMISGEFESLRELHKVCPEFIPKPYTWGKFFEEDPETYFLLEDFRENGEQPPEPVRFAARLAELHKKSVSPTGKFGFHTTTCHGRVPQLTDCWEESWEVLFSKQLAHMIKLDEENHGVWPEFQRVCNLTLQKVIPRLLAPLQSDGRSIKPCLIHGDLWDEATLTDMDTGEPFIYDPASMYAHNEYEVGKWRSVRHRLSGKSYMRNYKREFLVSEPEEDWDARNQLYSLRFELGNSVRFNSSAIKNENRQKVYDDMTTLCKMFCPDDLQSKDKYEDEWTPGSGEEEEEEEEEEDKEEAEEDRGEEAGEE
ncbi:hypothetical protein MMC11_001448 [Xylographa trunciseda]|nr:hypothetical protein [Xylographa trunciseda]